ncbi:MAG: tannase/feruloyl esterase family alpha/beta hydrolase [Rhodospirillaceae bacterium]|nr:tannase/feruloyl esterase family alpha/beta hydrolase [Rhodospirillaceae bacterium]
MTKISGTIAFLMVLGLSGAQAQAQTPAPQSESAARCAALGASDFSRLLDAPTQVTAAKLIEAASGGAPAYCQVQGYVAPAVGFELRLPAAEWNGKFYMAGCGGFCGAALATACNHPLRRGYACVATDMGHKSTGLDAKWAYNNTQAEIDFGYRSTHVTAVAGKAITEQFYAKAPSRSYFMGCSTGGRQGLVEAQKFPWDFDGIVAGAPVINETGAGMQLIWSTVVNRDKNGKQILGVDKLKLVNGAVVAKCDLQDNVRDGIIGDPRACGFDPAELQCKRGEAADCLTAAQVDVVRKIYAGPKNSKGEALYTGGAQPGSEMNWADNYISKTGGNAVYENFIGDLWRYLGFMPDPGPAWQPTDFDFDRDYKRLGMMETIYSGSNPDLRAFKARGGKMISYQGWADQSVVPLNVIDYYELAERTMGGQAAIQDFYRLFMVPGMNHCRGGVGADAIDYLSYLETWVEKGEAPDMMLAARVKPEVAMDFQSGYRFPLTADEIAFTRPAYPYPLQYRFKGTGDADDASNHEAVSP